MDFFKENTEDAIEYINAQIKELYSVSNRIVKEFFQERNDLQEKNSVRYYLQPRAKITSKGGLTVGWAEYKPNANGRLITVHVPKGEKLYYPPSILRKHCRDKSEYELVKRYEERFRLVREYAEFLSKAKRNLNLALNKIPEDGF